VAQMIRNTRIQTRLLIAFFIMSFFTLFAGLTGYLSLKSIGDEAVNSINTLSVLNDMYDYNVEADNGIYYMLRFRDEAIKEYLDRVTADRVLELQNFMAEYIKLQKGYSHIFTPGEMQNMENILRIYNESYIPILNEIIELHKSGDILKAISVYEKRLDPIYCSIFYCVSEAFDKVFESTQQTVAANNKTASASAMFMFMLVLASFIMSIILTFVVTKSISKPLGELKNTAEKMAGGNFDIKFEQGTSNDEVAHLSQSLNETVRQLKQAQEVKMESVEIRHEKEKAEAASRAKSQFLAKMSHEIRTPMNAIIGMAELAMRENIPGAAYEQVMTIRQAGANLLSIINDILDYSKIESGRLEIIPAAYEFSSLINDVISIIRMRVIDSQLKFTVNVDCNINNELFGDEVRIRQILLNILSNAVKYTESGHISLTVAGETSDDESAVNLVMSVADSGKGIRKEDMEKLFGDFVQVDMVNNKGIEGTGLGLAITMSLVKAMGGDITVNSEYGKGSVFTVTLPQKIRASEKLASVVNPQKKNVLVYEPCEVYADSIVRSIDNLGVGCTLASNDSEFMDALAERRFTFIFAASSKTPNARKMCEEAGSGARIVSLAEFGETAANYTPAVLFMPTYSVPIANLLNGNTNKYSFSTGKETIVRFNAPAAKVLIVDDINTNLKVAEGLLAPYGMTIKTCKSGAAAVEAVRAEKYDLVLMDHMMPEMDGIEAASRIRNLENGGYGDLPIVALTANAVSGMKEMFLKCGFNDFLSKPIDIAKLNAVLEQWIPKEKRHKETDAPQKAAASADSDAGGLNITIDGINVKKGVSMMGGSAEHYLQTLEVFSKDGRVKAGEIKSALEKNDLRLYTTYVHALKGASANIGAGRLSDAASVLEAAGKGGDRPFIDSHNPLFLSDLETLLTNIDACLKAEKAKTPGAALDTDVMRRELAGLKAAITDMNAGAINEAAKNLKPFAGAGAGSGVDADIGAAVDKILENALIGEYDGAVAQINELLS